MNKLGSIFYGLGMTIDWNRAQSEPKVAEEQFITKLLERFEMRNSKTQKNKIKTINWFS